MPAPIDFMPATSEQNGGVQPKHSSTFIKAPYSMPGQFPFSTDTGNDSWSSASQSIVAIMRVLNEIIAKFSGKTRDLQMWMEVNFKQTFLNGSLDARDSKVDSMKKSLDSTQSINWWTMFASGLAGILGVGLAIAGGIGYFATNTVTTFANLISQKNVMETGAEWSNRPGVNIGDQRGVLADNKSAINNINRETSDRLAELKNQMSSLIAKICTAFEEALRSLSSIYKTPLAV